jgi:hypothetical protein
MIQGNLPITMAGLNFTVRAFLKSKKQGAKKTFFGYAFV